MWVRKSKEEIATEHRASRLSFRGPFFWFVAVFCFFMGLALRGPTQHIEHWPTTWGEILLGSTFFATVFAMAMYILQFTLRSRDPLRLGGSKIVMCDNCFQIKHFDGKDTCECGGKFEDFDTWKWVDEDG